MHRRTAIVLCVILVLAGSALIVGSGKPSHSTLTLPDLSPRQSPTWESLPPRATRPAELEPAIEVDYLAFYRALLRGEVEEAEELWTAIGETTAENSSEFYIAGARLALAKGDPTRAVERVWHAIGQAPKDSLAWSLLGVASVRSGRPLQAEQAFGIAQALDPAIAPDLLPDRWRAAVASGNAAVIVGLAETFQDRHPDSVFASYYRAEALLMANAPSDAITLLVGALELEPDAPALLWYTLGRAYLARDGYSEAATSLEVAAYRLSRGDTSLEWVSANPIDDLNTHLGEAYLHTSRCAEAESIFRRLAVDQPAFGDTVTAAVICQTPTPTLTPWIPVQIGTVTPRP